MTDQQFRSISHVIHGLTAIDELAAYRAWLRANFYDDPKLPRLEKLIDLRANELLDARR